MAMLMLLSLLTCNIDLALAVSLCLDFFLQLRNVSFLLHALKSHTFLYIKKNVSEAEPRVWYFYIG